jgi:hypothetical protein
VCVCVEKEMISAVPRGLRPPVRVHLQLQWQQIL